jgi:CheY-like chemotaxis protein
MTLCNDLVAEMPMVTSMNSRLNVLLIDEDHSDCALFGIAVDKSNLDIWLQTVPDGGRAVDYLEGLGDFSDRALHPLPDLVVLDLDMRLTGGLEFLEWRRASAAFSSLPVVLFSGFAYKGAIETALAMGATVFIEKPLHLPGWIEVVREICDLAAKHLQAA